MSGWEDGPSTPRNGGSTIGRGGFDAIMSTLLYLCASGRAGHVRILSGHANALFLPLHQ